MPHIRVMLDYFHPWPNSAGLYVSRARGWFTEAGLDVELVVQDPGRGDTLEYLARGEVDFGIFPPNRLLARRATHGQPLIAVAAVNHRGLEAIQTTTSTGITRPRDLAGRRLALNPTPRGRAMVRHLVAADGGDPDAVLLVDAGTRELTVDDIEAGEADATFGTYWSWDALRGDLPEERRLTWPVDEIGAPRYHSYLLGTSESLLAERPSLVRDFLAVTARGYAAAAQEQDDTLTLLEGVIPYFPRPLIARSLALIAPTWTDQDGRWGVIDESRMGPYAHWLAENGAIAHDRDWDKSFTNGLLDVTA
ncbi:NitT/TauT family transport system substrate-binding protein [Streptomyces sp. TLI_55]|uniref:ABC transporter substrate-binding protein n=1 Tax=Streptomyces sp. TLI_55 TaxID=1938861 RepID=UPI000BD2A59D|nr:ABC transporter substrate-binding protein [Streptomyces sp. TLI_55]SNX66137.1 NitT/TauT family transport system substrate-binding protein [Streptomyces sp. TLI_55]